ncbi:MAG: hypothetical protein SOZ00_01480 [Tidjanibacter sp.]|nr:hypothetical protein [Tidjanibacter sp.]
MQERLGVPICLITADNIDEFLLPDYPLHPAFEYLSSVHKSDYLRIYLARFYGGGWHDIKPTEVSFAELFDEFADPNIWWLGRPELKGRTAKVWDGHGHWIPYHWRDMVAASPYICRTATPLTRELYANVNRYLDRELKRLKRHPAHSPYARKRDFYWVRQIKSYVRTAGNYPINFTFFGDFLQPLIYHYRDHVSRRLPSDEQYCLNFPYR